MYVPSVWYSVTSVMTVSVRVVTIAPTVTATLPARIATALVQNVRRQISVVTVSCVRTVLPFVKAAETIVTNVMMRNGATDVIFADRVTAVRPARGAERPANHAVMRHSAGSAVCAQLVHICATIAERSAPSVTADGALTATSVPPATVGLCVRTAERLVMSAERNRSAKTATDAMTARPSVMDVMNSAASVMKTHGVMAVTGVVDVTVRPLAPAARRLAWSVRKKVSAEPVTIARIVQHFVRDAARSAVSVTMAGAWAVISVLLVMGIPPAHRVMRAVVCAKKKHSARLVILVRIARHSVRTAG